MYWLDKVLTYTVIDDDIAFLVPSSYWATVRNGNTISADLTENINKTIRLERRLLLLFLDNLSVVLCFLILPDKSNIRTLSENNTHVIHLRSLRNRSENLAYGLLFYLSVKLVQVNYIYFPTLYVYWLSNRIQFKHQIESCSIGYSFLWYLVNFCYF